MKSNLYFIALFIFSLLMLQTSCSNDDVPPPEEETEEMEDDNEDNEGNGENGENDNGEDDTDPKGTNLTVDYMALRALYEANDGNTLGWDLDDTTMVSWDGVTQENERVIELRMQEKGIKTLVPEMGDLENLALLDAGRNELTQLPIELNQLSNLEQLLLPENQLVDIVEDGLPLGLIILGLAENKLSDLPVSFQNLTNLSVLNLSGNFLEVAPPEFGDFEALTILNLSFNLIDELPLELGNLRGLEYLGIEGNNYATVPQEICNLEEFGKTEVAKDQNVDCDLIDYQYRGLKALYDANPANTLNWDLTDQTMQSWQGLIFDSDGTLLSISLVGFGLANIPPEIANLKHIFSINLRNNGIAELPQEVGLLINLRELFLRDNFLVSIPETIGNLKNLYWLELRDNQLQTIPTSMGNMSDIEILNLFGNQLTTVPLSLTDLEPTINELHLTSNNISTLPPEICGMQSLIIEQGICQ